jgi:hypothetical protein
LSLLLLFATWGPPPGQPTQAELLLLLLLLLGVWAAEPISRPRAGKDVCTTPGALHAKFKGSIFVLAKKWVLTSYMNASLIRIQNIETKKCLYEEGGRARGLIFSLA